MLPWHFFKAKTLLTLLPVCLVSFWSVVNKWPGYSVPFSSFTHWVVGGKWGTIQQRISSCLFCRRPLWAVLAWAGMSTLWFCPSSFSSADYSIAHPPRCPEGWFWRGCCGVWHADYFDSIVVLTLTTVWEMKNDLTFWPLMAFVLP